MNFEDTMTEIDFKRPLLDPTEERFIASLQPEPDLAVDGLDASWMSRLLSLFQGKR
jgi:hypothetical protein